MTENKMPRHMVDYHLQGMPWATQEKMARQNWRSRNRPRDLKLDDDDNEEEEEEEEEEEV
jgi:hypothetical protein